jgi:hypothetical protein
VTKIRSATVHVNGALHNLNLNNLVSFLVQLRLATASALSLTWQRPLSNGEVITHYHIDAGSNVIETSGPEPNFMVSTP